MFKSLGSFLLGKSGSLLSKDRLLGHGKPPGLRHRNGSVHQAKKAKDAEKVWWVGGWDIKACQNENLKETTVFIQFFPCIKRCCLGFWPTAMVFIQYALLCSSLTSLCEVISVFSFPVTRVSQLSLKNGSCTAARPTGPKKRTSPGRKRARRWFFEEAKMKKAKEAEKATMDFPFFVWKSFFMLNWRW